MKKEIAWGKIMRATQGAAPCEFWGESIDERNQTERSRGSKSQRGVCGGKASQGEKCSKENQNRSSVVKTVGGRKGRRPQHLSQDRVEGRGEKKKYLLGRREVIPTPRQ